MKGLVLAEKPPLMRLDLPKEYNPSWEKWDLKALPIIPGRFQYLPEDVKSVDKILA